MQYALLYNETPSEMARGEGRRCPGLLGRLERLYGRHGRRRHHARRRRR